MGLLLVSAVVGKPKEHSLLGSKEQESEEMTEKDDEALNFSLFT